MKFMECTTCKRLVQINETGTCLGCQRGFSSEPQEDAWKPEENVQTDDFLGVKSVIDLQEREKELEDALKIESPKSMDARKQASDGKRVGEGNAKRRKAPNKSKKEKKE